MSYAATHPIHATAVLVLLGLLFSNPAKAVPVSVEFRAEPGACDSLTGTPNHELGTADRPDKPFREGGQEISTFSRIRDTLKPCQPRPDVDNAPGVVRDMEVEITNRTRFMWTDLIFVSDFFASDGAFEFQNFDGRCNNALCFVIDNIGINRPLFEFRGGNNDLIFDPGETWLFAVQDWRRPPGETFVRFESVGVPSMDLDTSNASIVARRVEDVVAVPEPSTFLLFSAGELVLLGYGWRYRRRTA